LHGFVLDADACSVICNGNGQAALGTAVLFADDNVLRNVYQTTGQVTGVCGLQCGIGQALTRTVGCDEVLQNRQAFTVGRLDRARNNFTLRVGHQATDTGNLTQLQVVTTSLGSHHTVNGVQLFHAVLHGLGNLIGSLGPDIDQVLATFGICNQTLVVGSLDLGCLLLLRGQDGWLVHVRGDVRDRHGDT